MTSTTRRLGAFWTIVALLMSVATIMAPNASAHHPEVTASVECVEGAPVVSYTATSWTDDATNPGRYNSGIGVYLITTGWVSATSIGSGRFLPGDAGVYSDGSFTDALDPEADLEAGFGTTSTPGATFSGSFDASAWIGMSIQVGVRADRMWWNGVEAGDRRTSEWITIPRDCGPLQRASVSVNADCVEDQAWFFATVLENASLLVDLTGDGDFDDSGAGEKAVAPGNPGFIHVVAGGSVDWQATADNGFEFEGGDTVVTGAVTVPDCEETTTTTQPTTTTTTTRPTTTQSTTTTTTGPGEANVIFSAACDDNGDFVAAFSLPGASGRLDIDGDGVYGPGETDLGSGTYVLTGGTYMWDAEADAGNVFPPTTVTSGSGDTDSCVEVLGTTVTSPPAEPPAEVVAETLPFTGFESDEMTFLGLMSLLAGAGIVLVTARRTIETDGAAADAEWRNR